MGVTINYTESTENTEIETILNNSISAWNGKDFEKFLKYMKKEYEDISDWMFYI